MFPHCWCSRHRLCHSSARWLTGQPGCRSGNYNYDTGHKNCAKVTKECTKLSQFLCVQMHYTKSADTHLRSRTPLIDCAFGTFDSVSMRKHPNIVRRLVWLHRIALRHYVTYPTHSDISKGNNLCTLGVQ